MNEELPDFRMSIGIKGSGLPATVIEGESSPVDALLVSNLIPAIELFRSKARDYSDRNGAMAADLLGAGGQFAEIWRKIPKLKKGMWDGEVLENETVEEILFDLIGHCILALDHIKRTEVPPAPKRSLRPMSETQIADKHQRLHRA